MQKLPSTYFEERNTKTDMLILHSTAQQTAKEVKQALDNLGLSVHYVVDLNGEVYQLVEEDKKAYHAGISTWKEIKEKINARSIGIEIINQTLGQTPFPKKQISSLILLCREIMARHNIGANMVLAHSDIAPTRKPDPGICFPWQELAQNNVGLWYGEEKLPETDIKKLLETIGYNIDNLTAAVYAFCRHFLPQLVTPDLNLQHLVDNVYLPNFDIYQPQILSTLQKVAYIYKN